MSPFSLHTLFPIFEVALVTAFPYLAQVTNVCVYVCVVYMFMWVYAHVCAYEPILEHVCGGRYLVKYLASPLFTLFFEIGILNWI